MVTPKTKDLREMPSVSMITELFLLGIIMQASQTENASSCSGLRFILWAS